MARPKNTEFYNARIKAGLNEKLAADLLETDIETIKKWDKSNTPAMAIKLIAYYDQKYINLPGWHGWLFSRGKLMYKKQAWRPNNLLHDRKFRQDLELDTQILTRQLFKWNAD